LFHVSPSVFVLGPCPLTSFLHAGPSNGEAVARMAVMAQELWLDASTESIPERSRFSTFAHSTKPANDVVSGPG
jgi:hypothetical protein